MGHHFDRQSRVIITGASSGIGAALATELARRHCRLMLVARREDRLAELAARLATTAQSIDVVCGDITAADTREQIWRTADVAWQGMVDVLINNAGIGAAGRFQQADEHRLRRVMEVNFFAPAELIRSGIEHLQRGRAPVIVNIGSVLGWAAVPEKSEYCASKFALRGLSDSLRMELQTEDISVLHVSPNTTSSEFFTHLIDSPAPSRSNPWSMSPEAVAARIIRAIERGRSESILTMQGKAMVWLNWWAPALLRRLMRRLLSD